MLNVRKIADIAQKMFNFPFFSPRCYFNFSLLVLVCLEWEKKEGSQLGTLGLASSRHGSLSYFLLFFCQNDFIIHLIHFCTNVERFMPEWRFIFTQEIRWNVYMEKKSGAYMQTLERSERECDCRASQPRWRMEMQKKDDICVGEAKEIVRSLKLEADDRLRMNRRVLF